MSACDTNEMAALKAENVELRTRLEKVQHQLERASEQLQTSHRGHHSAASGSSSNTFTELFQHRGKQSRADDSRTSPLSKDEVLDTVFSFVGTGDYFYTAAVCSTWRKRYLKLCYSEANKKGMAKSAAAAAAAAPHKCSTSYRSACMTAARLQLALRDSVTVAVLQADVRRLAKDTVQYSLDSIGVLSLLKVHDMAWNPCMCTAAAFTGNLHLLQWLHDCGCPWDERCVITTAAVRCHLNVLKWLHEINGPWSDARSNHVMLVVGACGGLHVVEWLLAQEVQWPEQLYGTFKWGGVTHNVCWTANVVKWALAHGCTWGNWQCQQLALDRYEHFSKMKVTKLFEWAHQNGYPCTCEQQ
jgi:hypothetical protein